MSAESLQRSLAERGIAADVEARDRLALIRPRDSASARTIAAERGTITAAAAVHGFSHAAVEIAPLRAPDFAPQPDATLSRD